MALIISKLFIFHTLTALHNCFVGLYQCGNNLHYSRLLPIEGFNFFKFNKERILYVGLSYT